MSPVQVDRFSFLRPDHGIAPMVLWYLYGLAAPYRSANVRSSDAC